MRTAYFLSSYLYFNTLTSPTTEWIDKQMTDHGIEIENYKEFTPTRIFISTVLLIGVIIGEIRSHRFFVAQTYEEWKYPFKPQRCLLTLWLLLVLIWEYPENRFIQLLFLCWIQRVTLNHLWSLGVRNLSNKSLMYFVIPYIFGYVFKIIVFWYNMYLGGLLIFSLYYQAITQFNIWKLIWGILYTSSTVCFVLSVQKGWNTMIDLALSLYIIAWFLFFKIYYDFMNPHLEENKKIWAKRKYNFTK